MKNWFAKSETGFPIGFPNLATSKFFSDDLVVKNGDSKTLKA